MAMMVMRRRDDNDTILVKLAYIARDVCET